MTKIDIETELSDERMETYLNEMVNVGQMRAAAMAGVSYDVVKGWRKRDALFAAAEQVAKTHMIGSISHSIYTRANAGDFEAQKWLLARLDDDLHGLTLKDKLEELTEALDIVYNRYEANMLEDSHDGGHCPHCGRGDDRGDD